MEAEASGEVLLAAEYALAWYVVAWYMVLWCPFVRVVRETPSSSLPRLKSDALIGCGE
jgi:hypothetical protein